MIILLKGQIRVCKGDMILCYLDPVEVLGEMGFLLGSKRTATVLTEIDCEILHIYQSDLKTIFLKNKRLEFKILNNLIRGLANKLSSSNHMISELYAKQNELKIKLEEVGKGIRKKYNFHENSSASLQNLDNEEKEKRNFPRFNIRNEDNCSVLLEKYNDLYDLINISQSGFCAKLNDQKVKQLDTISGKLILNSLLPIDFVAIVRWVGKDKVGFEFSKITPNSIGEIKNFFDSLGGA